VFAVVALTAGMAEQGTASEVVPSSQMSVLAGSMLIVVAPEILTVSVPLAKLHDVTAADAV
jgi:hypothetical protein